MVRVKICGITNIEDALAAVEFGADALGFIFYQGSPRYIEPIKVREIMLRIPPFVTTVGVFVDQKRRVVESVMNETGLDVAQLHGNEPPSECITSRRTIKTIRIKELVDLDMIKKYDVSAFLLDTYTPEKMGGTGQIFNWSIALDAKPMGRIILAGGLTPDNVAEAVRIVRPYAVDVATGVEREKGLKDHQKMRLFIKRAKKAVSLENLPC